MKWSDALPPCTNLDTLVLNCYRLVTLRCYRPVTFLSRASWLAAEDSDMAEPSVKTKPRSRIVETARDLFRKHGIKGIGVDAIAEAAGTNKMTLYRHFGSKDALVAECLRDQAGRAQEQWTELENTYPGDPLAQLHGWVQMVAKCLLSEERGCDLANAAVQLPDEEHPARRVIEDFKKSQRERIAALCLAAGASDPETLADALSLLVEGARMSRQTVGLDGPSAHFVQVAETVIRSFTNKHRTQSNATARANESCSQHMAPDSSPRDHARTPLATKNFEPQAQVLLENNPEHPRS